MFDASPPGGDVFFNRHGRLDNVGLPVCRIDQIQPSTTENALRVCHDFLVGEGTFEAKVLLFQQSPFPSSGKVYAFSGTYKGKLYAFNGIYE